MLKHTFLLAALAASTSFAQAADVGVSVQISQPGVYGRIDIGRFPQPAVVVAQPVVVYAPRVVHARPIEPVYLWVPPGHQKHWGKHCQRYQACGRPVYFVQDQWYQQHVMAGHRGQHGQAGHGNEHGERGHGNGHAKGHGRGHKD